MRNQIECIVLMVDELEKKIQSLVRRMQQECPKLKLHLLKESQWTMISDEENVFDSMTYVFARYDAVLIPVSPQSLGILRMRLHHRLKPFPCPVVGIGFCAAPLAFYDLLHLGLSDFVSQPENFEELRIRLLRAMQSHNQREISRGVSKAELLSSNLDKISLKDEENFNSGTLVENSSVNSLQSPLAEDYLSMNDSMLEQDFQQRIRLNAIDSCRILFGHVRSYQQSKRLFMDEFEQAFLRAALRYHNGNISEAARKVGKNRRAFWELMRKHALNGKEYDSENGLK